MNENIIVYKKIADSVIDNPTWELAKQIFSVNSIQKDGNEYCLDRYFINNDEKIIDLYYKIVDEKHFVLIRIDIESKSIDWVTTVNSNRCYLTATSKYLSLKELSEITKLQYTSGWSKGDKISYGRVCTYSRINFEPIEKTSYETEDILTLLLNELEKDRNGVLELTKNSHAYISICKYQYISGNTGTSLSVEIINRLNALNLGIDIDMYIVGNEFKN